MSRSFLTSFLLAVLLVCISANNFAQSDKITVTITGLDKPLRDNVIKTISIANDINGSTRAQSLHTRAPEEIKKSLQAFGYYHPKISGHLTKENNQWHAEYDIDKGQATLFDEITIVIEGEGSLNPALSEFVANIPLKKNDQVDHSLYEKIKKDLLNTAFSQGYLDVVYSTSILEVDPTRFIANVNWVLKTGGRYFFDEVNIEQNALDDDYLKRFVKIKPGDIYRAQSLLNLQIDLLNTNYFSQIDIQADKANAINHQIPVTVKAEPATRQRYTGSIGYGTDTGYRLGLGYTNNRVNKKGHQFSSNLRLSEIQTQLTSQYKIPIGNPSVEFFDLTASYKNEAINDTDATQYAVGSSYNIEFYRGILRSFISIEQEDFSFGDGDSKRSNLLIPGVSYFTRQTKDTIFSRQGYSLFAQLKGGVQSVYSETSFLHGTIAFKHVQPLTDNSRWLSRIEYGRVISDNFNQLPPSQRFFTGGSRTVRGFAYQSISPQNSAGVDIGGNTMAVASVEYDYLVNTNMGLAAFYDAGDVTQNDEFSFKQSLGVGFRYRTPIGMVRVDLAKPIDDETRLNNEDDIRFHLSIGPDL